MSTEEKPSVESNLAAITDIISGKEARKFVADVEAESSSTGMPESYVALKNMLLRAVSAAPPEPNSSPAGTRSAEEISDMASIARRSIERKREEIRLRARRQRPREPGEKSVGEELSELAIWETKLIPLDRTKEDPSFTNVRLHEEPMHPEWVSNEGQHLSDLQQSMEAEGLKIAIVVEETTEKGQVVYLVRAGHRRRKAAIALGWTHIPAVVLPDIVPLETQVWLNILENTARKTLTTYELAVSAKRLRDEFHVRPADFARKTGFTPGYVSNLLGCIDRLPDYLIEHWKNGTKLALDQWISLSYLDHEQAIKQFHKLVGISPRDRLRDASKRGRHRPLPPPKWLNRMQRLYIGIEGSELPPRTRDLVLRVIEVCMGQSDDVPGVYEPKKQKNYERKARLRAELRMPDVPSPGEEAEMPPPTDETYS